MLFVSLGTQDKPFERLLNYLEEANIDEEIIVQAGYTKFKSDKMTILNYISDDDFNAYLSKARIVICHGGVGTIMKALKLNKKVIACARLAKYKEHQNDHQLQIIKHFKKAGSIIELDETNNIADLIETISSFEPKPYISNQTAFLRKLESLINSL